MSAAGAAKDRLKLLVQGKHPYKAYNYFIHRLGLVGEWTSHEKASQAVFQDYGPFGTAMEKTDRQDAGEGSGTRHHRFTAVCG